MPRLALIVLGVSLALPAIAQPSDWQQQVQGLVTGNKNADDAVRQAYERGYQRGRDDEARMGRRADRNDNNNQRGYDSNQRYDNGNQRYNGNNQPSSQQTYSR